MRGSRNGTAADGAISSMVEPRDGSCYLARPTVLAFREILMRAEIENLRVEIEQSLALLRRHL